MNHRPFLLAAAILALSSYSCAQEATVTTKAEHPVPATTARKAAVPDAHSGAVPKISAAESLERLKAGNLRFVEDKLTRPNQTAVFRRTLASSQHPFAIVLGCADSRTAPELLFDQGLGDFFVVRVAGNVLNDEIMGSIEYAVEHLGAQLVVVLGHERCGAVKAARETVAAKTEAPGHIQSLVKAIQPAVESTIGEDAETTAKANITNVAKALRECAPLLKEKIADGSVKVVGAHYDLDTGVVEFLKD